MKKIYDLIYITYHNKIILKVNLILQKIHKNNNIYNHFNIIIILKNKIFINY